MDMDMDMYTNNNTGVPPPTDGNVAVLVDMGFAPAAALTALMEFGDNLEAAMNSLLLEG
jgi:hypothetical protein